MYNECMMIKNDDTQAICTLQFLLLREIFPSGELNARSIICSQPASIFHAAIIFVRIKRKAM
jgi:hypothetical protein